jgi:uncharacterized protein YPO0396
MEERSRWSALHNELGTIKAECVMQEEQLEAVAALLEVCFSMFSVYFQIFN